MQNKKSKIMLVDDNKANLAVCRSLLSQHYEVFALSSADKLLEFLKHVMPDLILLDIDMPGMNGCETVSTLKTEKKYSEIPVIFVSAKNSEADEYAGLALGVIDYITKPFTPVLLLNRIENHLLVQKINRSI